MNSIKPNEAATQAAAALLKMIKTGNGSTADFMPLINKVFAEAYRQGYKDCIAKLNARKDALTKMQASMEAANDEHSELETV